MPAIELHEGLTTGGTSGTVPNHTNSAESWSAARARCATPLDRPPPTGVREPCSESIVCAAGHQSPFTTVVLHTSPLRWYGSQANEPVLLHCQWSPIARPGSGGAGRGWPARAVWKTPAIRAPSTSRSIFDLAQRAAAAVPPGFNEISLTSSTVIWRWLELAHSLALPSRSSRPCIEYGDRAAKDCGSTSLARRAEA